MSNWRVLKTIENKRHAFLFLSIFHIQCSQLLTDSARSWHIQCSQLLTDSARLWHIIVMMVVMIIIIWWQGCMIKLCVYYQYTNFWMKHFTCISTHWFWAFDHKKMILMHFYVVHILHKWYNTKSCVSKATSLLSGIHVCRDVGGCHALKKWFKKKHWFLFRKQNKNKTVSCRVLWGVAA